VDGIAVINATIAGTPAAVPIGPLSVVASLEGAGYQVHFLDYQVQQVAGPRVSGATFWRGIRHLDLPILGISTMSGNLPYVLWAVRKLKEERPDQIVILGGPGATDASEEILAHFPVDVVVRGEGEITTVELVNALRMGQDLADVRGIAYRCDGEVRLTPPRERLRNLDRLPWPAYHHIDMADYAHGLHVMTSRGCPFGCTFCSTHSIWQRRVTSRSMESVLAEIESMRNRISWITFCDDNLCLQPERVVELCRGLVERGLSKIPWMTYGRVNLMTEALVRTMAKAGCEEVFYGIESGSNAVLARLRKKIRIEEAREVLRMTSHYVLQTNSSYIWGYPFETLDDFLETIMTVSEDQRIPGVTPHFYQLGPFAQTPLYQEYHHLLRFDPESIPNVGTIPVNERLTAFPELVDLIRTYPRIFPAFYHYDHPELPLKRRLLEQIQGRPVRAPA
jgi:radical SAM superfamily enzyme YgiQ (UPF0313 family)